MNTLLWIFQGLLAFVFVMAGMMKLSRTKAEIEKRMAWAEGFSAGTIRFIGLVELLGGLGVVFPMLLDVVPILTPISAAGLALDQFLAALVHNRRKESVMVAGNVILLVLAAMVSYSRF
jgi:uncharacterized membrane protein YphA (DoxX/SURF4 family)